MIVSKENGTETNGGFKACVQCVEHLTTACEPPSDVGELIMYSCNRFVCSELAQAQELTLRGWVKIGGLGVFKL